MFLVFTLPQHIRYIDLRGNHIRLSSNLNFSGRGSATNHSQSFFAVTVKLYVIDNHLLYFNNGIQDSTMILAKLIISRMISRSISLKLFPQDSTEEIIFLCLFLNN